MTADDLHFFVQDALMVSSIPQWGKLRPCGGILKAIAASCRPSQGRYREPTLRRRKIG
jgi:hypothetical protein